jgi:hypothetical protein
MANAIYGNDGPAVVARNQTPHSGLSGVWADFSDPYIVRLEAFGPTEDELQKAIDRYLEAYPWASYHTRFDSPREIACEFIALGSRNGIDGWL